MIGAGRWAAKEPQERIQAVWPNSLGRLWET